MSQMEDFLTTLFSLTPEQMEAEVEEALREAEEATIMKLGEWLVSKGFVTEEQLNDALVNQRTVERGKGLGKILIDAGIITKDTLKQFFKEEYSLECVDEQLIWNFLQDRNINNITEYAGVLGIAPDLLKNILIRDKFLYSILKRKAKTNELRKLL